MIPYLNIRERSDRMIQKREIFRLGVSRQYVRESKKRTNHNCQNPLKPAEIATLRTKIARDTQRQPREGQSNSRNLLTKHWALKQGQ